jgi:hypothetical protein
MTRTTLLSLIGAACFGFGSSASAAPGGKALTIPDFTRGDAIPAKARHDWNLGPTGLRGWMFGDRLVTTDARQIAITAVDAGSPADGLIAVGDVLLGAGGKPFSYDPRTEMGLAITAAETEAGGGRLALTRWREGHAEEVTLRLRVLGTFSATAPYDCPKSQRVLAQGLRALAARMAQPDYPIKDFGNPPSIRRACPAHPTASARDRRAVRPRRAEFPQTPERAKSKGRAGSDRENRSRAGTT